MDIDVLIGILTNEKVLETLIISTCVGIPVLLLIWAIVASAIRRRKKALTSQNWPFVNGTILSSEVVKSAPNNPDENPNYSPSLVYQYEVRSQRYQGDTINYDGDILSSGSGGAQAVVDRYRPGSLARVYYNPQNPEQSVLERNTGNSLTITIWVAVLIAILFCGTSGLILTLEIMNLLRNSP